MDFSVTLDAVKSGSSAYRVIWRQESSYQAVLRLISQPFPMLVMVNPDGSLRGLFDCAQNDLLAKDWSIVP